MGALGRRLNSIRLLTAAVVPPSVGTQFGLPCTRLTRLCVAAQLAFFKIPYKALGVGGCGVRWFTRYHAHVARTAGRDARDIGRANRLAWRVGTWFVNAVLDPKNNASGIDATQLKAKHR